MPNSLITGLFLIAISVLTVTGCGQKGPLYFPQDDQSAQTVTDQPGQVLEAESAETLSDELPADTDVPAAQRPFPDDLQPADS